VVDVHVGHVRRKLTHAEESPLIHTVRGVGYMLSEREPT
jgi:DNA-binding response OmpR family regulator